MDRRHGSIAVLIDVADPERLAADIGRVADHHQAQVRPARVARQSYAVDHSLRVGAVHVDERVVQHVVAQRNGHRQGRRRLDRHRQSGEELLVWADGTTVVETLVVGQRCRRERRRGVVVGHRVARAGVDAKIHPYVGCSRLRRRLAERGVLLRAVVGLRVDPRTP